MNWDAITLERLALILGTISGLLLVPEVVNLFPLEQFEDRFQQVLADIASIPFKLLIHHVPLTWQRVFYPAEVFRIQVITAISTFLLWVLWGGLVLTGFLLELPVLIIGGLLIAAFATLRSIVSRWHYQLVVEYKQLRLYLVIGSVLSVFVLSGPLALVRLLLIILFQITVLVHSVFQRYQVFRAGILLLAIMLFMVSQGLQFWATFK